MKPAPTEKEKNNAIGTLQNLGLSEFASLFGCSVNELPQDCAKWIQSHNFRYYVTEGVERDRILLDVLKKVDSNVLTIAGQERQSAWEKGWGENLEAFLKNGDVSKLVPKYVRPGQPLRLFQEYIVPEDPDFEINWYAAFRLWLFRTYLKDASAIYEFGCGSAYNLPVIRELYPDKRIVGLDWAQSSVDIVNKMAQKFGWKMEGRRFDFFHPDKSLSFEPSSVVMTIGALEQTGQNYHDFLGYLLDCKPALCVNIEPTIEWYDENNIVDYAAIRFHRYRRYWEGFVGKLSELEKQGRVKIVKTKRSYFGSLFVEGYSQIIWRPV